MIASIIIIGLAFGWLFWETDWMRVRLSIGKDRPPRQWQFKQYGDDCIIMRDRCYISGCRECRNNGRFHGWRIPARTVKAWGSVMNFKEGCNIGRAKILKDIARLQSRKSTVSLKGEQVYHRSDNDIAWGYIEPSIDILVDGELKASLNGNFKRGLIADTLKPYTTKVRIGRKVATLDVGEADRV